MLLIILRCKLPVSRELGEDFRSTVRCELRQQEGHEEAKPLFSVRVNLRLLVSETSLSQLQEHTSETEKTLFNRDRLNCTNTSILLHERASTCSTLQLTFLVHYHVRSGRFLKISKTDRCENVYTTFDRWKQVFDRARRLRTLQSQSTSSALLVSDSI